MQHQKEATDNGLAKAFGIPRSYTNTLLIEAGICNQTALRVGFNRNKWDAFIKYYKQLPGSDER